MYALKAYALSGAIKKEKETETEIQRETEIQKRGTKGQDNEPDTNTYFLWDSILTLGDKSHSIVGPLMTESPGVFN